MSKKVIVDFERLKYPNTGLYTFCHSLLKQFEEISSTELDLNYYLPKNFQSSSSLKNSIYKNQFWHKYFKPNYHEDIWHITHQGSAYISGNKQSKKILTIHDLNFLIEKADNPSKIVKYKKHVKHLINQSHQIICISNYVKEDVLKNFNICSSKIEVIYNGCEIYKNINLSKPKFDPKHPFYFSIGTILPKKNFHVLIPLLKKSKTHLIIAGKFSDKNYVEKIKQLAKDYKVQNQLHLLGEISDQDKHWYYQNCEAFLFPSIAEGFGLPVIEAMQYGKPIFLSKHTSLPEIGGDDAYYFDNFEDEMMIKNIKEGLLHYENQMDRDKIIKRSELFSWKNSAKQYLDIYKNI
jgi:glycosyltransferase involved in cell wall biosynthesis